MAALFCFCDDSSDRWGKIIKNLSVDIFGVWMILTRIVKCNLNKILRNYNWFIHIS